MCKKQVYETAICLARMWGVAETLEPLPNRSFQEVKNTVIEWAEAYVTGKEQDLTVFFVRKMKEFI